MYRMQTRHMKFTILQSPNESETPLSESSDYLLTESGESEKVKVKQLWSLKGLSYQIKELVSQIRETTYKELAQILIQRLQTHLQMLQINERKKEIQNLKRRVYDSINVMVAIGLLRKEKKKIRLVEQEYLHDPLDFPEDQLQAKNEVLREKRKRFIFMTRYYQLYQRLIQRNANVQVDDRCKQLPMIAIGVRLDNNMLVMGQRMNQELWIKSQSKLRIYNEDQLLAAVLNN